MLLAVDVGNTETVVGVFRGHRARAGTGACPRSRSGRPTSSPLVFGGFLEQQGLSFSRNITGVAIASVVPPVTGRSGRWCSGTSTSPVVRRARRARPASADPHDNPREVGADRIANALAAHAKYGGPCIVVDFGTATTFDAVSENGEYLGGAIAPGRAGVGRGLCRSATARLPRVEIVAPKSVIGKNTVDALQSGLVYGTAAEVDGIVERMQKELGGHATVVATGGLAAVVVPPLPRSIDHHEPWLTLEGLRLIFERNVGPR